MQNRIKNILKEYVQGLINLIGDDLKNVILYGSYARGEQDTNGEISDIDIMILVDLDEDDMKNIEKKVLDYSYDLDLKYNVLISPIIENVENYNKRVNYMAFYKNVAKEGVCLNG